MLKICDKCGDQSYLNLISGDKDLLKFIGIGICPDCKKETEE
jgi:ssDNA-binding Zn-finger/Zn-ribbon topoisomerase 1